MLHNAQWQEQRSHGLPSKLLFYYLQKYVYNLFYSVTSSPNRYHTHGYSHDQLSLGALARANLAKISDDHLLYFSGRCEVVMHHLKRLALLLETC